MIARKLALELAKVAGYHDDTSSFTRLVCEARASREAMNEAWHIGKQAKANGVKCSCRDCNNGTPVYPKDGQGNPYTPDRVRSMARDHVAYGWSPRPGGWTGEPWTAELVAIYHEEYNAQTALNKGTKQ